MLSAAAFLFGALAPGQTIELYRSQHRPAAELLAIAESALADEGRVTLDSRTATLVLNGTPAAVARALLLLRQIDRPLRSVVLTHEILASTELEALGVGVDWQTSVGPLRAGTLPLERDGIRIAVAARRETGRSTASSTLRLLEGGTGVILTGEAFPVLFQPYPGAVATEFVPAETGIEASAFVLGDGSVRLDLRPFSGGANPDGTLRYTAARTSVTVTPGETLVLGETSREGQETTVGVTGGVGERSRESQVLMISVEVER